MSKHVVQAEVSVSLPASDSLRLDRVAGTPSNGYLKTAGWLARVIRSDQAMYQRRSMAVRAYVGANGSFKTACMVRDALPSLDAGRLVYSTVVLLDSETGEPHANYRPFSWPDFLSATHADFLLDEVIGIASSRESSSMTAEINNRFNQMRKDDITCAWTAPSWKRADIILREVTQAVTECTGFLSDASKTKGADGEAVLWAPKRLARLRTFDVRDFEEWTAGKRDRLTPDAKEWWWAAGHRALDSYNTLDTVQRVPPHDPSICGHVHPDGTICKAKVRPVGYCKGHEDE